MRFKQSQIVAQVMKQLVNRSYAAIRHIGFCLVKSFQHALLITTSQIMRQRIDVIHSAPYPRRSSSMRCAACTTPSS